METSQLVQAHSGPSSCCGDRVRLGCPAALMSPATVCFAACGSSFTSLRRAPQSPAQAAVVARPIMGMLGRWLDEGNGYRAQRSKGGGPGEAGAGGESPDSNSPVDCLCLASAWCASTRHERSPVPVGLGPPQTIERTTVEGRKLRPEGERWRAVCAPAMRRKLTSPTNP